MAPATVLSPQAFATTQLHLLSLEQSTEVAESQLLLSATPPTQLARAGLAILNLTVASQRTGLGGRTVLELSPDPALVATSSTSGATRNGTGGGKGSGKGKGSADLPEHLIRTGDIVRVSELAKGGAKKRDVEALKAKGAEGVVTRVGERAVWVAVGGGKEGKDGKDGDEFEGLDGKLWVVKLANDVTYKRMNTTLTKLLPDPSTSSTTLTPLTRILLGLSQPTLPDLNNLPNPTFTDPTLNPSQKSAIRFALASPSIALIHGPPGTGKTHTLIELTIQLLLQSPTAKILICAPSNIAVDNIVERLAALPSSIPSHAAYAKPTFLRLGHPARLLPSVLAHSLDILTSTSDAGALVSAVRADIDAQQSQLRKARAARDRRAIYAELRDLRRECRIRETRCVDELLRSAQVVCATLHGAGSAQLRNVAFDVVVVDEASQALEAACWIPLLMTGQAAGGVRKLILAGDHLQLPPTIKSTNDKKAKTELQPAAPTLEAALSALALSASETKAATSATLETTLFDRLLASHGPDIKALLTTQYRMHAAIMRFPSAELYAGALVAADGVGARLLTDLPYAVAATDDTRAPLVFVDTQGGEFGERAEDETLDRDKDKDGDGDRDRKKAATRLLLADSKCNPAEASLVAQHVRSLLEAGVRETDVAVITPYNAQLGLLRGLMKERWPGLELGSVDGFQGREKECVVVSLVRSNQEGEVGFLGEKRRLNVAMTRPKRHLCVIGDSETVSRGSPFLKRWMKFLEENADLRYPNLDDLDVG